MKITYPSKVLLKIISFVLPLIYSLVIGNTGKKGADLAGSLTGSLTGV